MCLLKEVLNQLNTMSYVKITIEADVCEPYWEKERPFLRMDALSSQMMKHSSTKNSVKVCKHHKDGVTESIPG